MIPAACLHYPKGDTELTKAWIKRIADDPNARTILCGDQFDIARTTYRKYIRAYGGDNNSQEALDGYIRAETRELADLLRPIAPKILGLINGNHVWQFTSGLTNDQLLCEILEIPYLGTFSMMQLDFTDPENKRGGHIVVVTHHSGGCRGSRTQGGDVAALKRFEDGFDADIYIAAHTHRRHSFKQPQIALRAGRNGATTIERNRVYIRAGAFLKGYNLDTPTTSQPYIPSYAEEAAYPPTDLGWVECEIGMKKIGFKEIGLEGNGVQHRAYVPTYNLRF